MKRTISISLLLLFVIRTIAQTEFELPEEYEFNKKSDYKKYDTVVVAAAKWLVKTPLNEDQDKRKEVNKFIIEWVSGSPTVTVSVTSGLMKLFENNSNLLVIYMAYYSKYCIEHTTDKEPHEAAQSALKAVNKVYKKGIGVTKNKSLEKLKKAIEDGTLAEFEEKLNKV